MSAEGAAAGVQTPRSAALVAAGVSTCGASNIAAVGVGYHSLRIQGYAYGAKGMSHGLTDSLDDCVFPNVNVETCKWGQGAKDIGGEIQVPSLDYARFLRNRGYILDPDPLDPGVEHAFKEGAIKSFARHSRLGSVFPNGFFSRSPSPGGTLRHDWRDAQATYHPGALLAPVPAGRLRCATLV